MITYRIQIETHVSIWFLKKEYLTYPQALKGLRMRTPKMVERYGHYVVKIYEFKDETRIRLMS